MALICFYSHDGEGLGHFRRNLALAETVTARLPGTSALLLTGAKHPGLFKLPPGCDSLKIPTLQKTPGGTYESPLGAEYGPMAAELRRAALKTALRTAPPDMLVVDKHPGGFQGELLPALTWLRRHCPQTVVVLGLRDILDEPQQVEAEWRAANNNSILRRFYSRVWIYGDARLCPATEAYGFAPELARMARSCGFVASLPTATPLSPGGSPALVATVGGGSDGRPVLEAAARAAAALRADYPKLSLRLFAGPLMPADDYRALRREAELLGRFIRLERFSNRMPRYIAGADAVIAMGGYNTVLECVALGRPAVIVPREHPRREQLIRAESFEQAGLVQTVRMGELQTSQLELKLRAILSRSWIARDSGSINLDGRDHVLHDIKTLLENRRLAERACA